MAGDGTSLEIADVIYRRDRPGRSRPSAWLTGILARYPGCSVAAMPVAGHRYLVATRADRQPVLAFLVPDDHGFNVLACAAFVYGWLCAGWPLDALGAVRLETAGTFPLAPGTMIVPMSFLMFYEDLPSAAAFPCGWSSLSRRRTSSASGEPTPE